MEPPRSKDERFIPAHAGNRTVYPVPFDYLAVRRRRSARQPRSVHPRARGEQLTSAATNRRDSGSSPRTRGTGRHGDRLAGYFRFIPAHAGNRVASKWCRRARRVHPRARGEQRVYVAEAEPKCGSSPRTRGTGVKQMPNPREERFIPAHAGNRMPPLAGRPLTTVHPRARGEQLQVHHSRVWDAGSSPRTRGTVNLAIAALKAARFIPAHAGNRTRESWPVWSRTVHPRARGEQEHGAFTAKRSHGSSPRTRGTGSATGMRSR